MKKAVITGERQSGVVDAPDPVARENWVVLKVHASPMCTEYKGFMAGRPSVSLGHEAAGEVVEVAQPGRVAVGDRVVAMPQYPCGTCALCVSGEYIHCQESVNFSEFTGEGEGRATMAQMMLKPDWILPPIPDDISYDHASMACCGLGPTFGAQERMDVHPGEILMITGLGPVGLGGVVNGSDRNARVIAVDTNEWRRKKALDLGAEVAFSPDQALEGIRDLTSGLGVDAAVDCSGAPAAHRLGIDGVRRRGRVAFVGECSEDTVIRISPDMIRKGITLHGSWHYNLSLFPRLMGAVRRNPDKLETLISHRFDMANVQDAFELQTSGECAKVLLRPWGLDA
ncbi:MAG: alcohol dehydrogenase [Gemmatimonadetes bacterium]|nr:alcohol dehydrogenase [Gemmatimonadota bacterium]|tara:strand:- start:730 stop:1752 length:1023 start_codon:yes stop_codon:yes gene_type:complete